MTMYFLDSSAVVKRYFQEPGHEWIETLHDPTQRHVLYIAQAALVEVVASATSSTSSPVTLLQAWTKAEKRRAQ